MLKRTLIALEACYLGTLLLGAPFMYAKFGNEPGFTAASLALSLGVVALTGQIALVPTAHVLARRAPLLKKPRFPKLLGLQWLAIVPAGVLLMLLGTLMESSPEDGAVAFMALLLGFPLGLLVATALFLPAMLISTFFIDRAAGLPKTR